MIDIIKDLEDRINAQIIGQEELVQSLVIGLITEGNILLEGLPGLAKTRAVNALSNVMDINMNRVQFTPDLLPSDITGTEIYNPEGKEAFQFKQGPIFTNLVLADEINRAPAKVQSALLEAMEEHQVTVAGKTYKMDPLFMVIATQNPVEQEGTYPLPEAQLDRFMMKVEITYLNKDSEEEMLKLVRREQKKSSDAKSQKKLDPKFIFECRDKLNDIEVSEAITKYIVRLIDASRFPDNYTSGLSKYISIGASPRGSIALDKAARCLALMKGKDYVDTDDVREIAHRILRHRIALTYQASADRKSSDDIVTELLKIVPIA
ncbi:AAA family ATPase [Flammeovirga kamogawensis]|uniref:AAA family ATPase n=1 Tax=Flammeovirga kamogawensis TaxID=373891 RepID=A0ABX8GZN9_9BACT|nr:AAA family ATPase [Flammeovirga kamogawensis]MBB6459324.1 MoxR-like ATPase [Flammeovirga kamogawensis]QWG08883.1 AAA family ATPase [Flammeovirga kamogawensis]TRX67173.1 AAA family ATPase [Flammeovirga kamogawensis]